MSKKAEILRAATHLLAVKGYKEASVAELANLTDVAQGTIFYHYKNKEELFLAILKSFQQDIIAEFTRYRDEHQFESGLQMVEEVIAFYMHMVAQMEDRFMLLHRHDAYELARVNPTCHDCLEAIYNCLIDIFEHAVAAGQKDGSIRAAPARRLAMIVFTMVDGLVRFHNYQLYDAGVLYEDVVHSCRTLLQNNLPSVRS
ncbi:MAG: TetR/AcrR family transcriptional regulator [Desulfobacteraceae bacterium]|nr:MAG: TetR/AcrR family transcriptional regulator [Desulfobacteraceae bacterium]